MTSLRTVFLQFYVFFYPIQTVFLVKCKKKNWDNFQSLGMSWCLGRFCVFIYSVIVGGVCMG